MGQGADMRLATYGTLQPGKPNHHQLSALPGSWTPGTVRGYLHEAGWGAGMGFPGLVVDPEGDDIPVQVLESADLPLHWDRLDAFEGEGYRRVPILVETPVGNFMAQIYVLAME
jgi:gamma-glutamylcyclotransferase (GGCT)/AIG2-like uncharacterized protein YtfP